MVLKLCENYLWTLMGIIFIKKDWFNLIYRSGYRSDYRRWNVAGVVNCVWKMYNLSGGMGELKNWSWGVSGTHAM